MSESLTDAPVPLTPDEQTSLDRALRLLAGEDPDADPPPPPLTPEQRAASIAMHLGEQRSPMDATNPRVQALTEVLRQTLSSCALDLRSTDGRERVPARMMLSLTRGLLLRLDTRAVLDDERLAVMPRGVEPVPVAQQAPRCGACRHWREGAAPPDTNTDGDRMPGDYNHERLGTCDRIIHGYRARRNMNNGQGVADAWTVDGDDYGSGLITRPTFGCVHYEAPEF